MKSYRKVQFATKGQPDRGAQYDVAHGYVITRDGDTVTVDKPDGRPEHFPFEAPWNEVVRAWPEAQRTEVRRGPGRPRKEPIAVVEAERPE